jgi:hypothetical protein
MSSRKRSIHWCVPDVLIILWWHIFMIFVSFANSVCTSGLLGCVLSSRVLIPDMLKDLNPCKWRDIVPFKQWESITLLLSLTTQRSATLAPTPWKTQISCSVHTCTLRS